MRDSKLVARPAAQLAATYKNLRRVHHMPTARVGQLLLSRGERGLRKAILPRPAIPVVHMHRQRNDGAGLAGMIEFAQPVIGRWATVAALACIEFDERGAMFGARCAACVSGGGAGSGGGEGNEQRGKGQDR